MVDAVYTWQRSFSAWTMFEAATNLPKHTAVARGIENPGKKTSEITLHMGISDWLIMILVTFGILIVVIAG